MENKTVGRDMATSSCGVLSPAVGESDKSDFVHHYKHNKKSHIDGGAEEEERGEHELSSSAGIRGGIFTMTIPLENKQASGGSTDVGTSAQPQKEYHFVPRPSTKTTIRLTVPKLSSLRTKVMTGYQYVANLPWRLAAKTECTKRTGNVKFFSVYIDCNPDSESTLWSCSAVVEFRLISQKSSGSADFTRQFTNKFNYFSNNWGFPSFMEWSEITNADRGFIREDNVLLEAEITVQKVAGVRLKPTFDFSASTLAGDGVLVIDGARLFINKSYLALLSPVFDVMFNSKFAESEMKEIPIEDVVLEEFVEFLNVIYPSWAPVTSDTVEFLLELGDKFEIQLVIDKCERFLIDSDDSVIPRMTKLAYADQYTLSELQDICVRSFKDVHEIKQLRHMEEYRNLSNATKAALLEKVLKLV